MLSAELLAGLVAFDTTSRESNLELVAWVQRWLSDHGVASEQILDRAGGKAGLIARIGPAVSGGVVLCAHTDTVPVDGQHWSSDPFSLTRSGDLLLGRGAVDMKGFLACVLAAVPQLVTADLQRPVWLALTRDEEIGCLGAPDIAHRLAPEAPALAIVGEPTAMAVVRAHKGVRVVTTTVRGRAAHGSQPQAGANAIVAAARVVTAINELARDLAERGLRDRAFDPPHTTCNVGTIHGGSALNIVASDCEVVWEYRCVPGDDPDDLLHRLDAVIRDDILPPLQAHAPEASVTCTVTAEVPPLDPAGNGEVAAVVAGIGGLPESPGVAYGTDGAALQQAGIPTVVCGPGDPAAMHQPDEHITVGQLAACDRFLGSLAAWAAGTG